MPSAAARQKATEASCSLRQTGSRRDASLCSINSAPAASRKAAACGRRAVRVCSVIFQPLVSQNSPNSYQSIRIENNRTDRFLCQLRFRLGSNHQASFAQSGVHVASIASFAYSTSVPDNDAIQYIHLEQILVRSTSTKGYIQEVNSLRGPYKDKVSFRLVTSTYTSLLKKASNHIPLLPSTVFRTITTGSSASLTVTKPLVSINLSGSTLSGKKGQADSISSPIALYNVIIPEGNPNRQNYILHTVTDQRKG